FQAQVQHGLEVVLVQRIEHAQLDVGQGAHRQGHGLFHQSLYQGGVFDTAHTVVDAFDLEQVQRADDVGRWAFLARVGDHVQTQFAATGKHAGELFGRVTTLAGIQANTHDEVAPGQGLIQGLEGRV